MNAMSAWRRVPSFSWTWFLVSVAVPCALFAWGQQRDGVRLEAFAIAMLPGPAAMLLGYLIPLALAGLPQKPAKPRQRNKGSLPVWVGRMMVGLIVFLIAKMCASIWGADPKALEPFIIMGLLAGLILSMGNVLLGVIHAIRNAPASSARRPQAPLDPLSQSNVRTVDPDDLANDRGQDPGT